MNAGRVKHMNVLHRLYERVTSHICCIVSEKERESERERERARERERQREREGGCVGVSVSACMCVYACMLCVVGSSIRLGHPRCI